MNDPEKIYNELNKNADDCSCPTGSSFEAMAVQFGYRASNVNATAMESFQLQVAAQNSLLLKMQGELTKPVTS